MQLIEDAYDHIDIRPDKLSARHLESARRAIEGLFAEWANDDINIWKISEATTSVVSGTGSYTIGTSGTPVIDVINVSLRDSNNYDTPLELISQGEYQLLPRKTNTGKPTQYTVFRTTTGVTLSLYPVPDASTYTLTYHTLAYIGEPITYDAGVDLPRKFQPALLHGLAYKLALRNKMKTGINGEIISPGVDPQHVQDLRQEYMQVYAKAKDADRERASFYAVPYVRC